MDAKWDVHRGKARFFGHFGVCLGVMLAIAAIAEELGASFLGTSFSMFFLWPAGLLGVWIWENQDLRKQRNGPVKGKLDLWSKWLGLTAGAAAWWTWFV